MIFHHFSPFFGGLETKSFPPVVVGEEEVFNNSNQDWSILTKLKKIGTYVKTQKTSENYEMSRNLQKMYL